MSATSQFDRWALSYLQALLDGAGVRSRISFILWCLRRTTRLVLTTLLLLVPTVLSAADYRDAIGYLRLQTALGRWLPDGAGVPVAQVEAPLQSSPGFWQFAAVGAWWLDVDDTEFHGKQLKFVLPRGEGSHSGHANAVGRLFFGGRTSIAHAISRIDLYSATDWTQVILRTGDLAYPAQMNARVINHSWVGSTGSPVYDGDLLRRLDWSVNTDRSLHVVGVANGNPSPPLLGNAFNVVSVGRSDGMHGTSTREIDSVYREGRALPLLVVPMDTTSAATPVVAAAAAMLVQTAQRWSAFSDSEIRTLEGGALRDGARPEVVKAILMAGARREFDTGTGSSEYRAQVENRTDNGLDRRFGAGQLDVLNSYAILSGGEQRSAEDGGARQGAIEPYGYDFDDGFGGDSGTNEAGNYRFRADARHRWITVTLGWNCKISTSGTSGVFEANAQLHDLDLELYDDTIAARVAASTSWSQNTETAWLPLTPGHHYRLVVRKGDGSERFSWRYALAWRIDAGELVGVSSTR